MSEILIVDDEALVLMMLADVLEDEGYEVTTALNGQIAWETVQERRPHLIVTDFMMPAMTGLEPALAVRGHPDLSSLPIILVSGAQAHIARDYPGLFRAVLEKPYRHDVLLAEIARHLGG
jgi:CheY-like chemotaxis protein